jgi:hypothetical protein
MVQGYFWRNETTYHFPSETFFSHRQAIVAVDPRWFHGLPFQAERLNSEADANTSASRRPRFCAAASLLGNLYD